MSSERRRAGLLELAAGGGGGGGGGDFGVRTVGSIATGFGDGFAVAAWCFEALTVVRAGAADN